MVQENQLLQAYTSVLSLSVDKCSNMGFRSHSILSMSILRCGKDFFFTAIVGASVPNPTQKRELILWNIKIRTSFLTRLGLKQKLEGMGRQRPTVLRTVYSSGGCTFLRSGHMTGEMGGWGGV